MLQYASGNLLDMAERGEFDCILHGANCFNTMGGGIAYQIAERYPEAVLADQATKRGDFNKLGGYSSAGVTRNGNSFNIVNAYTQYGFANHDNPDAFEYYAFGLILRKISHYKKADILHKIGMPEIGCGLAGGNRDRIFGIAKECAEKYNLNLTIVSYG